MKMQRHTKRQPMQPIEWDGHGVLRFKENPIVRYMLDRAGYDLNTLHRVLRMGATAPSGVVVTQHDWDQFNQLIGYSVSGCPIGSKRTRRKADERAAEYLAAFPADTGGRER